MLRVMMFALGLAAAFLLSVSCSGSSSDSGDAKGRSDGFLDSKDGDTSTADVPVGQDVYVPPPPECVIDADCESNEVCDCAGRCSLKGTKQCEEDKNCGSEAYCDPCVLYCFPKKQLCEPCNSEHYCNPVSGECIPVGKQCDVEGSRCLDYVSGGSYCGRACLTDAGCPGGFECMDLSSLGYEAKQCVAVSASCQDVGQCEADTDCEYGNVCSKDHVCVPGCQKDTECPMGYVCSAFRCQLGCDPVNNPCPEGQECDDTHHCKIPGGCIDMYDCPQPATYCDDASHTCLPGCLTDFDCKSAGKECKNKECVQKGCNANYWCSFGQVCNLENAQCEIPPEPFCQPGCQKDEECGPEPSKCLQLQDKDGNDKGTFCFPRCYDDPANPCPQGYQCVELTDQDGKSAGKVCARACYQEPVGF